MATDRYLIELTIEGNDKASSQLKKVNAELAEVDGNSRKAGQGFDYLGTAVTAAGLYAAAQKIGAMAVELQALGADVDRANITFEALAGGTDAAADGLARLRATTGGVVDDLTLMQGANSLLLTGIASTVDEAADLEHLAITLGGALNQGPGEAIENLNAALLNNSFARLDTLGISAAAVRERVNELKETGLDMSEAFKQAVLEEGANSIDRLGTAASAAVTPVALLGTQLQNLKQDAGDLTNELANTLAQLVILANYNLGGNLFGIVDEQTQQIRETARDELLSDRYLNPGVAPRLIDTAMNIQTATPDIFNELDSGIAFRSGTLDDTFGEGFTQTIASQFGYDNTNQRTLELLDDVFAAVANASEEAADAISKTTGATEELNTEAARTPGITAKNADAIEASAERQADALREATQMQEDFLFDLQNDQLAFQEGLFSEGQFGFGGNTFFDPAALDSVLSQADELQTRADEIAQLAAETDFEVITRDEVSNAQDLADEARAIADEAQRAADAFEQASLATILGEGDGGRLGEISDIVLSNIEDPEQRAAAEQSLALASGEQTIEGIAVREELAPVIAQIFEEYGTNAGVMAAERLNQALEDARLQGLSGDDFAGFVQNAIGFAVQEGEPGTSVTVNPGEGRLSVAARAGVSLEELDAVIGEGAVLQPGQVITFPDGTQLVPISSIDPLTGLPLPDTTASQDMPGLPGDSNDLLDNPRTDTSGINDEDSAGVTEEDVTNMTAIAEQTAIISEYDLSSTFTTFSAEIDTADTNVVSLTERLEGINSLELRAEVDLVLMLTNETGLTLRPLVKEQLLLILQSDGLPPPSTTGGVG